MTALHLPHLTDQQARALVGGIGLLIVVVIATLWLGRDAAVAVIGIDVLWLLWNRAELLDDNAERDERLSNLEMVVAGWLPDEVEDEAVGGWPEEEPNEVVPGDAELATRVVVEPDDAPTEEFPAVQPEPATEPMRLGDEIEADFRAHQVHAEQAHTVRRQMVEKTEHGMTFRVMEDVQ